MDVEGAYQCVLASSKSEPGRFYGAGVGAGVGLGKGCIYSDAIVPIFDVDQDRYRKAALSVYILTHECDVDDANQRLFNESVLVCPVTPLEDVVAELVAELSEEQQKSFYSHLGAHKISRLTYLPPVAKTLPYGGILYLNSITNSDVERFKAGATFLCAVSAFGLQEIEYMLDNHLLRPKADRLSFAPLQPHAG